MKYEKSCGAVIYTIAHDEVLFLIEKMKSGYYALCKGHVEQDETEIDTARREIEEETNLQVDFIDGFRERIEYCPYRGCRKEVIFFLAKSESMDVIPQESEVKDIYWLPYDAAMKRLTHRLSRNVLAEAKKFMGKLETL